MAMEMKRMNHGHNGNGVENDEDDDSKYDNGSGHADHDDDNDGSGSGSGSGSDYSSDGEGDESDDGSSQQSMDHMRRNATSQRAAREATRTEFYSERTALTGDTIRELWGRHSAAVRVFATTRRRGCRSCLVDTFSSHKAVDDDDNKLITSLRGPLYQPMIGVTLTQSLIVPSSTSTTSDAHNETLHGISRAVVILIICIHAMCIV
jgi:hypothetical protein